MTAPTPEVIPDRYRFCDREHPLSGEGCANYFGHTGRHRSIVHPRRWWVTNVPPEGGRKA
jgi:hypothetical protein